MTPFIRKILSIIALFGLLTFVEPVGAQTDARIRENGSTVLSIHVEDPLYRGQTAVPEKKPTFAERVRRTFSNFLRDDEEDDWNEEPTSRPRSQAAPEAQAPISPTSIPTRPPKPVRTTDIREAENEPETAKAPPARTEPARAERSISEQRSATPPAVASSRTTTITPATIPQQASSSSSSARTAGQGGMNLEMAQETNQSFDSAGQEENFFNKLQEMRKSVFDKQMENEATRHSPIENTPRIVSRSSTQAPPNVARNEIVADLEAKQDSRTTEAFPFRERPAETAQISGRKPVQESPAVTESRQVTIEGTRTPVLQGIQGIDRVPRQGAAAVTPSERRVSSARGEQQLGTRVIADTSRPGASTPNTSTSPTAEMKPVPIATKPEQLVATTSPTAATVKSETTENVQRSALPRKKAMLVSPRLDVETESDTHILVGQESNYRVRVVNRGGAVAENVTLRIDVPSWIEIAQPDVTQGRVTIHRREGDAKQYELIWTLGLIRSQAEEQLVLRLIPRERKSVDLKVRYEFDRPSSVATVDVQEVVLELELDGPDEVMWGTQVGYRLVVRNVGNGDAEDIQLELLQTGSDMKSCELPLLRAGEEQSVVVDVWTGKQASIDIDIQATAAFDLKTKVQKKITVLKPDIFMTVESPTAQFVGKDAEYVVKIQNMGTADAKNLMIIANVPLGADLVSCSEEGTLSPDNQIIWKIPALPIGELFVCNVVCKPKREGDCILETAVSDRSGILAQCDGSLLAVAITDLKLEVATPEGPVEVGKEAVFTITLDNRGTKSAENVEVTASFGRGLEPFAVEGGNAYMKDGQVVFDAISAVSAGQKVTLKVKGKAESAGSHRIRTDIVCSSENTHLVNEQTAYFFQGQRGKNTVVTSNPSQANRSQDDLRSKSEGRMIEAKSRDPFMQ